MESSIIDEGLIEVILEKLEKQRLPIPLINRHPEYHALAAHVMCLFEDISAKALAIEKRS
jgi:hypothetical protein